MKTAKPTLDPLERDPLMRNKLLHLKPYLNAKNLVEIRINQPGTVIQTFADGKKMTKPDPKLSFDYLENMGKILANLTYQRFSEDKPILACKLPGGHRVQIVAYESVSSSFAMVIRIKRQITYTMDDFGLSRTEQKGVLAAIAANKTILVSGGTGTGKTSLTNCLIPHIPAEQRIVTIEGVAELVVPHEDWCALTYSENRSGISSNGAGDLLRASLRLSPDRILLGEIHTENAAVFASAINTGHEGSIATIHANNPRSAIVALISKMIVNGSIDSGSIGIVQRQLCEDIHGIIQIDRDPKTHRRKAYFETMDRLADLDLKSEVAKEVQQHGTV